MSSLMVGAAKEPISVPERLLPYPDVVIFGDSMYTSVRKEIWVRAIAIRNGEHTLLLLVQETGSPENTGVVKDALVAEHGIPRENIIICSTHNHSTAPAVNLDATEEWGLPIPEARYEYSRYLNDQTIVAARRALVNLRPARVAYGTGQSHINVNRDERLATGRYVEGRNPTAPSDKTLSVLKFVDADDRLIAAFVTYAVHSVMTFRVVDAEGNKTISGDLAGEVSEFVEAAYSDDDAVVAWAMSAGGNQNPSLSCYHNYLPDGRYQMTTTERSPITWELVRHLGQRQGMDILGILTSLNELHDSAPIKIIDRQLSLPGTRVVGFTKPMIMDANLIDDSQVRNEDSDPLPLALKLIKLGDVPIFAINGEVMSETGIRLREEHPDLELMLLTVFEEGAGGKYLADKWGFENRTFAYYRNRAKDAVTEDVVSAALKEMLAEAGA